MRKKLITSNGLVELIIVGLFTSQVIQYEKYVNKPIQCGNVPLPNARKDKGYYGYTLDESKVIWNFYIEIPKDKVEMWEKNNNKWLQV